MINIYVAYLKGNFNHSSRALVNEDVYYEAFSSRQYELIVRGVEDWCRRNEHTSESLKVKLIDNFHSLLYNRTNERIDLHDYIWWLDTLHVTRQNIRPAGMILAHAVMRLTENHYQHLRRQLGTGRPMVRRVVAEHLELPVDWDLDLRRRCDLCGGDHDFVSSYNGWNTVHVQIDSDRREMRLCGICCNKIKSCRICGVFFFEGLGHGQVGADYYCGACMEQHDGDQYCRYCNSWHPEEDMVGGRHYEFGTNTWFCNSCASQHERTCTNCNAELNVFDRQLAVEDGVMCHRCYQFSRRDVMEYNFFDDKPVMLQSKLEKVRPDTLYLGVEIEVEMDNGYMRRHEPSERTRGRMAKSVMPKWFGYAKHDGSLNHGIEIVSNPMTEMFYKEKRSDISKFLVDLEAKQFRTDQEFGNPPRNNVGLHVHMSKAAFTSAHLYKFVRFFYKKHMRTFVQTVCERNSNNFARYNKADFDASIKMAKDKKNMSGDRYSVINMIGGHFHLHNGTPSQTVEFRLFQGTLDPEKWHKNIEFMLSTYHFTRDASLRAITLRNFFKFLRDNRSKYRNLINFINGSMKREV